MSQFTISLLSDLALAGLLVTTIAYCVKLQRRLKVIQNSRGELAHLMQMFDECTERATKSIAELQAVSRKVNESLTERIGKANGVADDLHFLLDKANKLAANLDQKVTIMQQGQRVISELERRTGRAQAESAKPHAQPLSEPPKSVPNIPQRAVMAEKPAAESPAKTVAGIETLLEKISARPEPALTGRGAKPAVKAGPQLRTQAERELYEALKNQK
jgi:hypothetical protein